MNLEIASLFLILFAVIIIVWGIAVVHTLPGKIAAKRNHSQNVPLKKGDPLFLMDPAPKQAKVDEIKGQLAEAEEKYNVETRLVKQGAGVREKMINLGDEVDTLKAELAQAQFHLDNTQIVAPSDGYVVNLQLREGVFIRLKAPVMTFVDTTDYYLIAEVLQKATQWIDPGDQVEVALEMYPGKVFPAEFAPPGKGQKYSL